MKTNAIITALFGIAVSSGAAVAGPGNGYWDNARVLKTEPIYETVRVNHPERRCWRGPVNHTLHHPPAPPHPGAPTVAGAILGGVVGNQFGGGSGKTALTAAGAVLGAVLANDIAEHHAAPPPRPPLAERCATVDVYSERQELVGYRVKYSYKGDTHWTRTKEYPGERIRIRVSPQPDHRSF